MKRRIMAEPADDQAMRRVGPVPQWPGPGDDAACWSRDEDRMRPIMATPARG